jgi:hypothetical protein
MGDKLTYKCKACGKMMDVEDKEKAPECCGVPMEKLPYCTKTFTAEQARAFHDDEPCDDGRASKGAFDDERRESSLK